MYKKALSVLMVLNLLFLVGYIFVLKTDTEYSVKPPIRQVQMDGSVLAKEESSGVGILAKAASGQRVVSYNQLTREKAISISEEEYGILLRIVEAEAGGEDEDGKLLVANVILNRVKSKQFPGTIKEVVFQQSNNVTQFSPIANGRYYSVNISASTIEAVERALDGEDISEGALYFAARKYADCDRMKWFDDKLEFLFQHGGHEFFR